MGSFLDWIGEDGEIMEWAWPPVPQSIYRGDNYCWDCGSYVHGAFDTEDCIKKCDGFGSHVIGHNGQYWLPAVRKWCVWYNDWKKTQRAEREDAAIRLGATVHEAMGVP